MPLHCIAYVSNVIPALHQSELDNILETSISYNSGNDITGALIKCGTIFIQVIEGKKLPLENLMNAIKNDVRHHKINEVYNDSIRDRTYPQWDMKLFHIENDVNAEHLSMALKKDKSKVLKIIEDLVKRI